MHIAFNFTKDLMSQENWFNLCLHKICGLWQMPWFILSFFCLWKFVKLWNFVLVLFCQLDESRNYSFVLMCCNILFVSSFFEEKRLKWNLLIFLFPCNIFLFLFFDLEKLGGNLFANFLGLNLIVLFMNSLGIELPLQPFTQSFKGFEWEEERGR